MISLARHWPWAIIHIVMNTFFASFELRNFLERRDKPVAITNGEVGGTVITCSYQDAFLA